MLDHYTCIVCAGTFPGRNPARKGTTNTHCSRSCAARTAARANAVRAIAVRVAARITRDCVGCGESFTTEAKLPYRNQRYCSQPCYTAHVTSNGHPNNGVRVSLTCGQCGAGFTEHPYRAHRTTCSRLCWNRARAEKCVGPKEQVRCRVCGSDFLTWPYRVASDQPPCCSQACYHQQQQRREWLDCESCGSPFYIVQSRSGKNARFCSKVCEGRARRITTIGTTAPAGATKSGERQC